MDIDSVERTLKRIILILGVLVVVSACIAVWKLSGISWGYSGIGNNTGPDYTPAPAILSAEWMSIDQIVVFYNCDIAGSTIQTSGGAQEFDENATGRPDIQPSTGPVESGPAAAASAPQIRSLPSITLFHETIALKPEIPVGIRVHATSGPVQITYAVIPACIPSGSCSLEMLVRDPGTLEVIAESRYDPLHPEPSGRIIIEEAGNYYITVRGTDITVDLSITSGGVI